MSQNDSLRDFNVRPRDPVSASRHNAFIARIANMQLESAAGRRPPMSDGGCDNVVVKITGNGEGGGKYKGRLLTGGISIGETGNLSMPEQMTVADADNVVVMNLEENGQATHWLKENTFAVGKLAGVSAVVIHTCIGGISSPTNIGDGTAGTEAASTSTWNRTATTSGTNYGNTPLELGVVTRVVYNPSGDKKIYQMLRTLLFTADGKLHSVSAETRSEVSDTCVEEGVSGGTF